MFKSIALKMSAAVLGILSICFSGVINDALKVDAASVPTPNMGMFDYVQDNLVYRQTAYLDFHSTSDFTGVSFGNNQYYVQCTLSKSVVGGDFHRFAGTYNGVTSQRGFGYSNVGIWYTASDPGASDTGSNQVWFDNSANTFFFTVRKAVLSSLTLASLQSYIDSVGGFHVQYRLDSATAVSMENAMYGDNSSGAYQVGYSEGYSNGYNTGLLDAGGYRITVKNNGSSLIGFRSEDGSDYSYDVRLLNSGSSLLLPDILSSTKDLVFSIGVPSVPRYVSVTLSNRFGEFSVDLSSAGNSSNPVSLPYYEGDFTLNVSLSTSYVAGSNLGTTYFRCGSSFVGDVKCGYVYDRGYDAGVDYATGQDIGVYVTLSPEYSGDLSFRMDYGTVTTSIGSTTINRYTNVGYFNRPAGVPYVFSVTCTNAGGNTIPFEMRFTSSGLGGDLWTVLSSDMKASSDDRYYLPFWGGSISLMIVPQTLAPDADQTTFNFAINNDRLSDIKIGFGYVTGYERGYRDGAADVGQERYSEGHSDGYREGYDDGHGDGVVAYDSGYADGWDEAMSYVIEHGSVGAPEVIDLYPLMGAIITMPFTFFSQGLDWTLFEGSRYEFGVSMFFGSVLVVLMLWKILQLVIGLGK